VRGIAAGDPSRHVDRTHCSMRTARVDRQSCMRSSHAPRTTNPEPRVRENCKSESRKTDSGTVCRKTPSGGGAGARAGGAPPPPTAASGEYECAEGPVQLDFTVRGIKPISEGHSVKSLYSGAPYKYLYGGPPYKSPKISENRAACGGCDSLAARAADTYRQKSMSCRKQRRLWRISEVQPDLRGSLIVPSTVKSSCAGQGCPRARVRRYGGTARTSHPTPHSYFKIWCFISKKNSRSTVYGRVI
jgi:hypothetical protein